MVWLLRLYKIFLVKVILEHAHMIELDMEDQKEVQMMIHLKTLSKDYINFCKKVIKKVHILWLDGQQEQK